MLLTARVTDAAGNVAETTAQVEVVSSGPASFAALHGPTPETHMVTVDRPTLLDVDATVNGLHVTADGALIFPPDASRTLTVHAHSVIVDGKLTMRPASPETVHALRFANIDESVYVGGGHGDHHSDPGLVVTSDGGLDAHGTAKSPWSRAAGSLVAGATSILVDDASGWQVGDEITVVPSDSPTASGVAQQRRYDTRTVAAIDGNAVTLSSPLAYAHPSFTDQRTGVVYGAEVLNLTRNVRIEGTPTGRAHVMFHARQTFSHVGIRWMGPRKPDPEDPRYTVGVLGRYGTHFHHVGDDSRGSVLDGVVVRDTGNHAFVAHGSHGVTYTGCIAHDTYSEPFWWDPVEPDGSKVPSHDVAWVGCVASLVRYDPAAHGRRVSGFLLGFGSNNSCVGCVAVGTDLARDSAGFLWPEATPHLNGGVWDFRESVAHNNSHHGVFTWQNSKENHTAFDFVCYRNGGSGISHGAYRNHYQYRRFTCAENKGAPFTIHATSNAIVDIAFTISDALLDASGGPRAAELVRHVLPGTQATRLERCDFRGYTLAAVGQNWDQPGEIEWVDLIDCAYEPGLPHVDMNQALPGSIIREIEGGQVVATWEV